MERTANEPLIMGNLTKEQFDAEIAKGMEDIESDRVYSPDQVEEEMRRLYGGQDFTKKL